MNSGERKWEESVELAGFDSATSALPSNSLDNQNPGTPGTKGNGIRSSGDATVLTVGDSDLSFRHITMPIAACTVATTA